MASPTGAVRWIYDSLPPSLKRSVSVIPFAYRVGSVYRSTLRFLLESDRWEKTALREYQTRRLAGLLEGALRRVPHYQRYRRLLGRPAWQILAHIEPIEKADVQADPEKFLDPAQRLSSTYLTSTGGTSGQPLSIRLDKEGFQLEWAFMVAQWMRVGFRPGMRRATFRGVPFPSMALWQENPVYDELQFSPFAMTDGNLPRYVDMIRAYRPFFLYGFPSALTILAHYVEAHAEQDFPEISALLCCSENVRDGQREYLEKVFRARFFSWYGMSEKVILAGECEGTSLYHAFPQYGITEVRDARGDLSSQPGAEGELVGTGFINKAMPFIRYRLGDFAQIVGEHCDACGRHFPLLGPVRGRWIQEMIVGRSGARISLTALNMHGDAFADVTRFQFHQREKGKVTLRVVPAGACLSDSAVKRITEALRAKCGDDVEWIIAQVPSVELTSRGKGIFLVQELPTEPAGS